MDTSQSRSALGFKDDPIKMLFRSKKISKAFAWAQMTRGRMRSKSESISDTSSMQSMVTNGLLSSPVLLAWHPDRSPAVPQPAIRAHRVQTVSYTHLRAH